MFRRAMFLCVLSMVLLTGAAPVFAASNVPIVQVPPDGVSALRRALDIATGIALALLLLGIIDFLRTHRYAGWRRVFVALKSAFSQHPAETFASHFVAHPKAPAYVKYVPLHKFLSWAVRIAILLAGSYVGMLVGLSFAAMYWSGGGMSLPESPFTQFFLAAALVSEESWFVQWEMVLLGALAAAAFVNLLMGIGLRRLLYVLGLLFTQPRLFLGPSYAPGYGQVFHSLSKMPVPLARVQLVRADGRILRTVYADWHGRYRFHVAPGTYTLAVRAPGFLFPSKHLEKRAEDVRHSDVYFHQPMRFKAAGEIAKNVPLDPAQDMRTPAMARRSVWRQHVHLSSACVLSALALVILVLSPTFVAAAVLFAQSLLLLVQVAVYERRMPSVLGVVRDARTGVPVTGAAVYLFDQDHHQQIDVQLTDRHGQYGFIVGRNRYVITVIKDGYPPAAERKIDCTGAQDVCAVAPHLQLGPGY